MTESDRLDTGNPSDRVYTHDLLTLSDSPRLGLGLMTMSAITARDYPVIMGVCLLSAIVVLAANLVTDILYALVDPTIQLD